MKNLIYIVVLLIGTSVFAQTNLKDVKEETEVKIIKVKDDKKTTEKKVQHTTRETSDVKLDENDVNKVNQNRIKTTSKIEKTVLIDNDADDNYDTYEKEIYYKNNNNDYLLKPNDNGFNMAIKNEDSKFVDTAEVFSTNANGYYIINGSNYSGMGYFDTNGNFVIEYYNKDENKIEVKTYLKNK